MKKYIILSSALAVFATLFSSCLKDEDTLDPAKTTNIVEFKNPEDFTSASGSVYSLYTRAFAVPSDPNAVTNYSNVVISYSGADVAPEDITVQLTTDAAAITAYNTQRSTSYVLMPTTLYTMPTSVTIKKGERTVVVPMTCKPGQFDLTKSYVVPLKISSASSGIVSGNFGTILLCLGAKNDYDGVYSVVSGTVQRYGTPGFTSPTTGDALNGSMAGNTDVTLVTVGLTTNTVVGLKWAANASGIAGIDNTQTTVDKATNNVTMASLGNNTLSTIPSTVNKYDTATKTFTLNFQWNPVGSTLGNGRQVTNLVLKYKGVR